jgi:hypothetical protein
MPLLSAPAWHNTRAETVPLPHGYLAAEPERVRHWQQKLSGMQGVRVALSWAGNPRMETGQHVGRSPPLAAFAPLMRVRDVSFVSLQKGSGEEQLDTVPFGARILRLPDLDRGLDAFLDSAAVLKCVDLLITSDTAIAHLGGALGVTTWLCLMQQPDWRWSQRGTTTPWYASMRLFRQLLPGDWTGVFSELAGALALQASPRPEGERLTRSQPGCAPLP